MDIDSEIDSDEKQSKPVSSVLSQLVVAKGKPWYHGQRVQTNIAVPANEDGDKLMCGDIDEVSNSVILDHFHYPFKSNVYQVCIYMYTIIQSSGKPIF